MPVQDQKSTGIIWNANFVPAAQVQLIITGAHGIDDIDHAESDSFKIYMVIHWDRISPPHPSGNRHHDLQTTLSVPCYIGPEILFMITDDELFLALSLDNDGCKSSSFLFW